jgi:hypothetical protein
MSVHRLGSGNGQYPGFGGPPMTDARAEKFASFFKGCDIVASCETGRAGCANIAEAFGSHWNYQRSQGTSSREGLNGLFWNGDVFHDEGLWDSVLASAGQWPRTFLMVRLVANHDDAEFVTAGSFHFAAKGAPLNAEQADRVKGAQIRTVRSKIGNKRFIGAGDLPRTYDNDDLAYLKHEGFSVNGRTDRTPLVSISRRAVRVTGTKIIETGSAFDHDFHTTSFTLPGKASAA